MNEKKSVMRGSGECFWRVDFFYLKKAKNEKNKGWEGRSNRGEEREVLLKTNLKNC